MSIEQPQQAELNEDVTLQWFYKGLKRASKMPFSRLDEDQGGGNFYDDTASITIAQLLFLEAEDSKKDITMYINSPGGEIQSGLAIIDAMNHIKCDVSTVCTGMAASMGAMILSQGTKGKRYVLPNSEVMIHQPLSGIEGQASDIELKAKHILKLKEKLYKILAEATGKTIDQITKDGDRDFWMDANEAKKYGIIDDVLKPKKK